MPFAVENPAALLLLLLLPGIYLLGRGRLSLMAQWRARTILGIRLLSMSAAILALASPSLPLIDASMSVAFVLDRSDSMAPSTRAQQEEWVRQAMEGMRPSDRAAVVTFAGEPWVARPLGDDKDLRLSTSPSPGEGTDIPAALRIAAGLLPASGLRKVVLLSDGWDTAGQVKEASRSLPEGTRVDVFPLPAMESQPEVLIESINVPTYVRDGDSFDVSVVVGSNREGPAQVRMQVDGEPAGRWQVKLGAGANLVTMWQKSLPIGFHSVEIQVSAEADTVPNNNSALGFVVVKEKGRVLQVQGHAGASGELRERLRDTGLEVERMLAGELPIQMSRLLEFDAVLLDDVSATSLSLDQMRTLQSYVRDQGRGLVVAGGRSSYGLGDYVSAPLEEVLPVSSNVPLSRERGDMALILVIDRSGSMDDTNTGDGVTRMSMAREAALQAIDVLRPEDQIGVVAFDIDIDWVVPVQKVGDNLDGIRNRISRIEASGGTDIYSALQAAYSIMRTVQATQKHITLVSDGQSWKGQYEAMIRRMSPYRITLTTIAIGGDADREWMTELAGLGGGRYYFTERSVDIPKIVYREVTLATRVAEVEGQVSPLFVAPSPVLRGMQVEGMPPLRGYVATEPKDAATLVLRSERGDPLLAQWQYGLGRVVAWTSDSEALWASGWVTHPEFGRIWDQALRWTMPPPIDRGIEVSTLVDGAQVTVSVDSVDHNGQFIDLADTAAEVWYPDGTRTTRQLQQTAPGRYRVDIAATQPGLHRLIVSQDREGGDSASEVSGFAISRAPELRRLGSDDALLKELASMTGGRAIRDPWDAFSRRGMPSVPGWEPLWPYLLALTLLLLPVEVALRRITSLPFARREDDDSEGTAPPSPEGPGPANPDEVERP